MQDSMLAILGSSFSRSNWLKKSLSAVEADLLETNPVSGRRTRLPEQARRALRALKAAKIPHAVIGAAALAARGLPRMTKDLDIVVLSAVQPCAFVAKRDVATWPLFGWLARAAGTIFVDRERRLSSPVVVGLIRNAIASGSVVVLFPEGTSSDGTTVLPFKSALLESAVQLRCPVAATAIQYALDEGSVADEVCYWRDMTLVPHLLNLFFKREIRSNCSFSVPKIRVGDRKEIARELREEIMSMRS